MTASDPKLTPLDKAPGAEPQVIEIEYSKPIAHGTNAGYRQHRERRVELCDKCRAARRQYNRDLKARNAKKLQQSPIGDVCGERRGTCAGYQRHIRHGQPACDPCKQTNSKTSAMYNARRRKAKKPRTTGQPTPASNELLVPYEVLGALLLVAPAEVEEWVEREVGQAAVAAAVKAAESLPHADQLLALAAVAA